MKNKIIYHISLIILSLLFVFSLMAGEKVGEDIDWEIISSGGNMNAASSGYGLSGTVSQTAVGSGSSSDYGLSHGFWINFTSGAAVDCGNVNSDVAVNILDITYLIAYLYKGGPAPVPYLCVGDVNGNDSVNILDITYLIAYLYKEGPPPVTDCCNPVWK